MLFGPRPKGIKLVDSTILYMYRNIQTNTEEKGREGEREREREYFTARFQKLIFSLVPYEFLTSSLADFGHMDRLKGMGDNAGACAHGIWNSCTTKWLITASTPANISIPCIVKRTNCKEI